MAGRREPRKGLPKKPLKTETVSRIKQIVTLMSTGGWSGRVTKLALAEEWGMTYDSVENLCLEASRHLRLALEVDRPYIAARFLAQMEYVIGDCMSRVRKGTPIEGDDDERMSDQDVRGYYQTMNQMWTGAMHVLQQIPDMPNPDGTMPRQVGGGISQQIVVVVKHANVPDEPPREPPAPPADPAKKP